MILPKSSKLSNVAHLSSAAPSVSATIKKRKQSYGGHRKYHLCTLMSAFSVTNISETDNRTYCNPHSASLAKQVVSEKVCNVSQSITNLCLDIVNHL